MIKVSAIVAVDKDFVIGNLGNNKLLWKVPLDLNHFKNITTGKVVIMGNNTYESIGKSLKNRYIIVLSRNDSLQAKITGVSFCKTYWDAIRLAVKLITNFGLSKEIIIAGGGSVYEMAYHSLDKIYLTTLGIESGGNLKFPGNISNDFKLLSEYVKVCTDSSVACKFQEYERNE